MQLSTQKELLLSKSINQFEQPWIPIHDQRSSLYFDQYRWCVNFILSEASCLRSLDEKRFEVAIENAKYWSRHYQNDKNWQKRGTETALRLVRNFLLGRAQPIKTVVSGNFVYVYTNDADLGHLLYESGIAGVRLRLIREAVISLPKDRIQLRHSDYAYRTYFRERLCSDSQKVMLQNFFASRSGSFRVSPGLQDWLIDCSPRWVNRRIQAYHFVDHNHPNEGTMISLVMPGIVRKTMPIEITK